MTGFIYRTGIRIKEFGERHQYRRIVIIGMAVIDWASGYRCFFRSWK